MAFSDEMDAMTWYNVLLLIVDGFFVGDIFVNFNTAVVKNELHIVTERKQIAIEYFKSWFLIDVLSVIPFDIIFEQSITTQSLANGGGQ